PARHPDALDHLAGEGLEAGGGEDLGELDQLHAEAHVGLVGAVALHGLVPAHAGDLAELRAGDGAGAGPDRLGDAGDDLVLPDEAGPDVELHERELPVGAGVRVAQAAGDLVVAVDPPDHRELLEQLGALRERVEAARLQARGHDEVPGALGRRGDEHGRLDLDEALLLHRAPEGAVGHRPGPEVALHAAAAQVDVAVAEPDGLVGLDAVVDRERRRLGRAQDLDRAVPDLDLAGGQVGVGGALGPDADDAGDAHHPLVAHVDRAVHDALDDALAVAQVDEREVLAVLAAAGDPAAQRHGLACVGRAQLAAPVRAHAPGRGVLGHSASTILRTRATSSSRGTVCCSPRRRSRTVAVPSASSCSPTITATRAPDRPATFICAFIDRPP